jgi:hypothetical protein
MTMTAKELLAKIVADNGQRNDAELYSLFCHALSRMAEPGLLEDEIRRSWFQANLAPHLVALAAAKKAAQ